MCLLWSLGSLRLQLLQSIVKTTKILRSTTIHVTIQVDILAPLEKSIQSRFIPALKGQTPPEIHTREILALPARLGGLGLTNPTITAKHHSNLMTATQLSRVYEEENPACRTHKAEERCPTHPMQSTHHSSMFHGTLLGKGSLHLAKLLSGTAFHSDMADHSRIRHLIAPVASLSLLSMP